MANTQTATKVLTARPGFIQLREVMAERMTAAVARQLGCSATFMRWEPFLLPNGQPNGAEVPVFGVPVEFHEQAICLGLRVEGVR